MKELDHMMGLRAGDKNPASLNQYGYDDLVMNEDEKVGLTKCGKFLKYSIFLFNAVILIAGCGLLGFGVYARTSETRLTQLSSIFGSSIYSTLTLVLIVSGGVVIVISFLGCCGAIKEVKCMLGTFFILLLLMLLSMIVGATVVYTYRIHIGETIMYELRVSLNSSYGVEGKKEVTEGWNRMQQLLGCCGVEGGINSTTSWAYYRENSAWFRNQTDASVKEYVPESCCRNVFGMNRTKCVGGAGYEHLIPAVLPPVGSQQENELLFVNGCYTAVIGLLTENVRIIAGLAAGISVLMMLGMTFAICLCRRIKDEFLFD